MKNDNVVGNSKIYMGHNASGERIELDFDKERISFVMLLGYTGTGKTMFLYNLIKQLSEKYSSRELGFVLLDMTLIDFCGWKSDYLHTPVISEPQEAIQALLDLTAEKPKKKIFVIIEECDMVHKNRKKLEDAFVKLKESKNIFIVYSTSRIDKKYLEPWMKEFVDLQVVFSVGWKAEYAHFLLGSNSASQPKKVGEKILAFNGVQIKCQPFSEKEAEILRSFKL